MNAFSIQSIQEGLKKKEFSATELLQKYLKVAKEKDTELHAFLSFSEDLANTKAIEIDKKIQAGESLPPLAGVPICVKDSILVKGELCTAGSRMLENYRAPYDATVIAKVKEAGALIIGKTNIDEFGMGASTENSAFGPTKNPHDTQRVPGGSSGGSAAAVASSCSVVALGEDTGGSIRLPASFCGVIGLKPTYGRVSRYGVISLASSLDQVGPFATNIQDTETLFHVLCGKDEMDSTSVDYDYKLPFDYAQGRPFDKVYPEGTRGAQGRPLRIGVPKEYFAKGLDESIEKIIRGTIQKLEKAGATIKEIELPHTKYALAAYYIINTTEASSNLARYDGMRYGLGAEAKTLLDSYLFSRGQGLGKEVKRRIMLGTYALSAGYYDAYYLKAQKVRTLLRQDFEEAFTQVDIIIGPVSPFLPFKIGERVQDPLGMYLVDIYTVPVNLAGLPAMSMPVGKVGNPSTGSGQGLPVGLHMIAPAFREDILFDAGKIIENMQ